MRFGKEGAPPFSTAVDYSIPETRHPRYDNNCLITYFTDIAPSLLSKCVPLDPMASNSQQDECPICQTPFSQTTRGSQGAKESHVQSCIESHLSAPPAHPTSASKVLEIAHIRGIEAEGESESCPICNTSYLTENFSGSDSAREAHFMACFESQSSSSNFAPPSISPPSYNQAFPSEKAAASQLGPTPSRSAALSIRPPVPNETPSNGSRRFSIFGFGGGKSKEQKIEENVTKADGLMRQRWGPPRSLTSGMVRRYWMATRMEQHWEYLRAQHPRQFKKYLEKGYMEPIPVCTASERSSSCSAFA